MRVLFWISLVLFLLFISANSYGLPQTGQTVIYEIGDDGYWLAGDPLPEPRFTDNADGTVTDDLTGLIWTKNADFFREEVDWYDAIQFCNELEDEGTELEDGSIAGDWRLPNIRELNSLFHYGFHRPSISNTQGDGACTQGDPFNNVLPGFYWASTTYSLRTDRAWRLSFNHGGGYRLKTLIDQMNAWCVK